MNRVIRLMHLAKLQARHKRRRLPGDTGSRLENHIAPNHLQRDFQASGPNQKWVAVGFLTGACSSELLLRGRPKCASSVPRDRLSL